MSDDEWGGMTWSERTEFAVMNIVNGNLTDAIGFIMHDGDVGPDSVVLALKVARDLMLRDNDLTDDSAHAIQQVTRQLITLIDRWERT